MPQLIVSIARRSMARRGRSVRRHMCRSRVYLTAFRTVQFFDG